MVNIERRARLLLSDVIRPTLAYLAKTDARLGSEAALQLLIGTAVAESGLRYPLLLSKTQTWSLFRIDLSMADEINRRYGERFELFRLLVPARMISYDAEFAMQLPWNPHLASAVARLIYCSSPEPLPRSGDIAALGAYWIRWYKEQQGGRTLEHFIRKSGPVIRAIWPYADDDPRQNVA